MKKLLSILLAILVPLAGVSALADPAATATEAPVPTPRPDGTEPPADASDLFRMPRIAVPTMPAIAVPEVPEIEVPKVPTTAPTKRPKIEIPEIPEVDTPRVDLPGVTAEPDASASLPADEAAEVEAALDALGEPAYRATYEALCAGETLGDGSRGDAARGLQQLLAALGQGIKVDGIIGPRTLAALNAAQDSLGLPRTKKVDTAGFAALLKALRPAP